MKPGLKVLAWIRKHRRLRRLCGAFTVGPRLCAWHGGERFPLLGVGFDIQEWAWGVDHAACRAGNNGIVPQSMILWELMKPQYLPLHYWITVPVLRLLFRYGLIGKARHRYPKVLTIGLYGITYDADLEKVPF